MASLPANFNFSAEPWEIAMADPAAREPFCANPQCSLHRVTCGERVMLFQVEPADSTPEIEVTRSRIVRCDREFGTLIFKLCSNCLPNANAIGRTLQLRAHEERIRNSPGRILSQLITERAVQLAASLGVLPNFSTNAGPVTEAELMEQQGTPVRDWLIDVLSPASQVAVVDPVPEYGLERPGEQPARDRYLHLERGHDMNPKLKAARKIRLQLLEKGFPPEKIQKFIASLKLD